MLFCSSASERDAHVNVYAINVEGRDIIGRAFTTLFADPEIIQQARAFLALDNMGSRQYDFKLEQGDTRLPLIIQAR